jgi:(1->4)-alpha-D-glucan 1-alpha-D-glucosylmutase
MRPDDIPVATYRIQLNRDFGFADAAEVVSYLHRLGISHLYASPYLKARTGSPHGYDIVDHGELNPEIGDAESFERLVRTLHDHGMGQLLDIVPNHMGVGGSDNAWWLDVLEHGEASEFNEYFDIDWYPFKQELQQKVLLPFLGDHYGLVLERGEIRLCFDADTGALHAQYFEHRFPIDVRTYPHVLELALAQARESECAPALLERLEQLSARCSTVPRRNEMARAQRQRRRSLSAACKSELREVASGRGPIGDALQAALAIINGTPGEPRTFDRFHRLLERQAFRLCYWQVASHEINYRRFFDINSLAGIRVEDPVVFERTHQLIGDLVRSGRVNGLRIDHPDGLSDPGRYCAELQRYLRADDASADDPYSVYLVLEKILARHERLPADWPIHGTTGYEFAYVLNALFVDGDGEGALNEIYTGYTGCDTDFDALLYHRKHLIIRRTLASELTVLANLLSGIAETDRYTRDFTYQGLREAIAEVTACFPVYRTYISGEAITDKDRQHVQWAVAQAKHRSVAGDLQIFDFIERVILEAHGAPRAALRRQLLRFVRRLQQYTSPVMAKGMEDTAFYAYNRLVSLNDVGFDPRTFGISMAGFHPDNRQRLADMPHTLVATSTHDSKRSEDVRARINVLSEVPELWRRHLDRWQRINRNKKKLAGTDPAPSANDEYLLYQTLLGTWPVSAADAAELDRYRQRIEDYMIKAIREAKVNTSWINPSEEYEESMRHFVHALIDPGEHNPFLADFVPLHDAVMRAGLYNALSQSLLKLTAPGVPDVYQGTETWAFNVTDPDNRRPVDFAHRSRMLDALREEAAHADLEALARGLLTDVVDGRAKLYVTWRALQLRQRWRSLFRDGDYQGLATGGKHGEHVCAFVRTHADRCVLAAAPRWFARLLGTERPMQPIGDAVWHDTWIALPDETAHTTFHDVFTGAIIESAIRDGTASVRAADLFRNFSVALLTSEVPRTE